MMLLKQRGSLSELFYSSNIDDVVIIDNLGFFEVNNPGLFRILAGFLVF